MANKNQATATGSSTLGWIALASAPMFFSTNIIFGRAAKSIDPFTLAELRWSLAALVLLIIIRPHWKQARHLVARQWKLLALLGFLGMWICGAIVYVALKSTSATNATLIYTTPPLMIIIIERFTRGRAISLREIAGIVAATLGIAIIITKGDLMALVKQQLNIGDLLILLAATAWAVYSVVLRSKVFSQTPTLVLFALIAAFGALIIAPFAAYELATTAAYPKTARQWQMVAGIVTFSSLIPFSIYQFGLKQHGSSTASIFMYLLPPFGLLLAWLLLGERLTSTTLTGCAFVLGGVILATFPAKLLSKPD
jgi:drug/metabolite transporter (DMT)-like permease